MFNNNNLIITFIFFINILAFCNTFIEITWLYSGEIILIQNLRGNLANGIRQLFGHFRHYSVVSGMIRGAKATATQSQWRYIHGIQQKRTTK